MFSSLPCLLIGYLPSDCAFQETEKREDRKNPLRTVEHLEKATVKTFPLSDRANCDIEELG
jgi:hypothetical protein